MLHSNESRVGLACFVVMLVVMIPLAVMTSLTGQGQAREKCALLTFDECSTPADRMENDYPGCYKCYACCKGSPAVLGICRPQYGNSTTCVHGDSSDVTFQPQNGHPIAVVGKAKFANNGCPFPYAGCPAHTSSETGLIVGQGDDSWIAICLDEDSGSCRPDTLVSDQFCVPQSREVESACLGNIFYSIALSVFMILWCMVTIGVWLGVRHCSRRKHAPLVEN